MRGYLSTARRQGHPLLHALVIQTIRNANGRAFIFVRGQLKGTEKAAIAKALPEMLRLLDTVPAPFIAKIYRDGSVALAGNA